VFGISHTKYTKVGDEYVRGVSGGERKRVSIAETLATKSTVNCWDNSTRGLDASTALDYAKSLRIMTDISNRTTLVTLYQAGEQIYEVMDKVMVIDAGRCIYQGPAVEAKQYFEDLGFKCPERQTTADFLTAVTDPTERQFRPGFEDKAPKTSEELEKAFRESEAYKKVLREISEYEAELENSGYVDAKEFEGAVRESKSKTVRKKSPYTVSFIRQVLACTQREFWLTWGDQTTLYTKFCKFRKRYEGPQRPPGLLTTTTIQEHSANVTIKSSSSPMVSSSVPCSTAKLSIPLVLSHGVVLASSPSSSWDGFSFQSL
jgi:energy-coupling factor transporter ATP-binding protein EcfA2